MSDNSVDILARILGFYYSLLEIDEPINRETVAHFYNEYHEKRLLCKLGIHNVVNITIRIYHSDIHYRVCKHCGKNHPVLTGEW